MTTKEKVIFFKEHGFSISYIANRARVVPATITRWIREEKGISKKNENDIELALHQIAKEILQCIGENNDWNL